MAIENADYSTKRIEEGNCAYTDFECLVQLNSILKLVEGKIDTEEYNKNLTYYKSVLEKAKLSMANSYLFPEISMFLKEPNKYTGLYFVRESNYRIRVDDVAHSIIGFSYLNNIK